MATQTQARHALRIEAWGVSLQQLQAPNASKGAVHHASIKLGSRHLRGHDIREQIMLPGPEDYRQATTQIALGWMRKIRSLETLPAALERPASYEPRKIHVSLVLSIAAALVAQRTEMQFRSKSEIPEAYTREIGDEFTPLVQAAFTRLRRTQIDTALVRDLEDQTLRFERRALGLLQM